ncbi:G protein-activated inward rectifier potassium channel 3-like [Stegodyphus dumicola]|uniref:G protein-activated inward rectifier potassium channel 3-like n=1 Tax=Stegodyphus dumicola TaxID=202533 RepID=UPI0015B0023B|nr:G protein-activated inward rectifier potassium channel 3-like [Stegodyphus dumicola]XP_035216346.1 G protein-activated inward rectifier potassium channel 3-like [Stegodyphus dumicola]XP_035216347.1 G protein-activated inward rectifier potassium channel 3-like [Stegodyphus dumicola]XP_035216348.1 G protein-activated inward rectifier potassium channel 3-like [Stegodyphus dumicola]
MKYFDPDNGGVWQEILPDENRTQQQDFDAISMSSASMAGENHRGLYRTKSTSSRYSLKSNGTDGGAGSGIVRLTRGPSSRHRKRVVLKNGTVNLSKEHVSKRSQRYLQDIFTTLVDIQWRYNLMVFAMGFLLSWLIFSLIWWLICLAHGDFDHINDDDWKPCVVGVDSFSTAFLFSVETQHTIGYGSRYTNDECPEAVFIMCAQSITGVMIQCFMAGIVFAKLSRPKKRSQTLMFSRYACVCLRDGKLCFMFRVGDMRKSHIIGAKISAQVIRRKTTAEGEVIPYYHTHLDVRFDDGGDDVFLIWPATIVHEINETSPFFLKSAEDMLRERYEVVAILEGTIESTGQSIQARSSYISTEILWGHRFDQVVSFRKETGEYLVDYSKFNATNEVQTPLCSARDFMEYQKMLAEVAKAPAFVNPPPADNSTTSTRDSYQRSNSSPEGRSNGSKLLESTAETPLLPQSSMASSDC